MEKIYNPPQPQSQNVGTGVGIGNQDSGGGQEFEVYNPRHFVPAPTPTPTIQNLGVVQPQVQSQVTLTDSNKIAFILDDESINILDTVYPEMVDTMIAIAIKKFKTTMDFKNYFCNTPIPVLVQEVGATQNQIQNQATNVMQEDAYNSVAVSENITPAPKQPLNGNTGSQSNQRPVMDFTNF